MRLKHNKTLVKEYLTRPLCSTKENNITSAERTIQFILSRILHLVISTMFRISTLQVVVPMIISLIPILPLKFQNQTPMPRQKTLFLHPYSKQSLAHPTLTCLPTRTRSPSVTLTKTPSKKTRRRRSRKHTVPIST